MSDARGVLADLIAQRAKLDAAIAALTALVPPAPVKVLARVPVRLKPRVKRRRERRPNGELANTVVRVLRDRGTMQAGAITDALPAYGVNGPRHSRYMAVYGVLRRLAHDGRVMQDGKSWTIAVLAPPVVSEVAEIVS